MTRPRARGAHCRRSLPACSGGRMPDQGQDRPRFKFSATYGGRRRCEVSEGPWSCSAVGATDAEAAEILGKRLRRMIGACGEAWKLATRLGAVKARQS